MLSMYVGIGPVVALIAGILILIVPRLLNYIVAVCLIVVGILGLMAVHGGHEEILEMLVAAKAHKPAARSQRPAPSPLSMAPDHTAIAANASPVPASTNG